MIGTIIEIIKLVLERVIPDPKERQALESKLSDDFARFIEATQPKSSDIYRWAATLIALVRPALAVFVVISPIIWTDRWMSFLGVLKEAGIWGVIALSPAWVWILGRDGVRIILGVVATLKGLPIPDGVIPPGIQREKKAPPPVEEPIDNRPDLGWR
ncbi:MAG: hypothetical protein QXJ73_08620 [Candidatus Caldarchaeum sp.]